MGWEAGDHLCHAQGADSMEVQDAVAVRLLTGCAHAEYSLCL